MRWIWIILLWASSAQASISDIAAAAQQAFARMPDVRIVAQIAGTCGASAAVDPRVAYCTTQNVILVAEQVVDQPQTLFLVGHAYGHAVQVQHGVADVALRAIRNRPDDEIALRGMVERQVDCIAGYLVAHAGVPVLALAQMFPRDPLTNPHWGRDPLRVGPVVDVPLAARREWFNVGQAGDIAACAPGEFTARLLIRALRD
jgi:hypothetical protein